MTGYSLLLYVYIPVAIADHQYFRSLQFTGFQFFTYYVALNIYSNNNDNNSYIPNCALFLNYCWLVGDSVVNADK